MKSNKAISSVTATAMFILIIVGGYVVLQNSLYTLSTNLNSEYDAKTNEEFGTSEIKQLSENGTLYFKNSLDNSLEVQDVKVEDTLCSISETSLQTGVVEINISSCLDSYSKGFVEVTLFTNRGVFSREVYYNTAEFENCMGPDSSEIPHDSVERYFNTDFITIGDSTNCEAENRYCDDGTLNGTYEYTSCEKELELFYPSFLESEREDICSAAANEGLVVQGNYVSHNFEDYGGEAWDYCTDKDPSSSSYSTCDGGTASCSGLLECNLITNITCS